MKEHVEHLVSSFVDYKGIKHDFVLVAISKELPKLYKEAYPAFSDEDCADTKVFHSVTAYDEYECNEIGEVVKALYMGVSICNPEDNFSEKIGIAKATYRAKNSKPVMFVSKNGYINKELVNAFLKQEAVYIQNNPGSLIKGYDEARDKYLNKKSLKESYLNLPEETKQIISLLSDLSKDEKEKLQKYVEVYNDIK